MIPKKFCSLALLTFLHAYSAIDLELVKRYIPENPVIIEAGANHGEDTIRMAALWPQGTIHAFEPLPNSYSHVVHNTHNYKNIKTYNCALSDKIETAPFYISSSILGASSLLKPTTFLYDYISFEEQPIQVECITLNKWAQDNNIKHVDFMWLDMEGTELKALQAGSDLLSTVKAIYTEVNYQEFREGNCFYEQIKTWLENQGFEEVWKEFVEGWQGNVLFVRKEPVKPINTTDSSEIEIPLEDHQVWWGKNFNDPLWLGGTQMASRASMRQQIKAKNYSSVLDIPCAYCIDFDGLQAEGLSVKYYGVDITKKMIDACCARGIDARHGSIEQIPLADSSVDLAYSRHILEHLPYYQNAIKDLVRVACKEVYIVFFIKPTYTPDEIHQDLVKGDLLYHNRYDKGKLERFIYSLDKVDHIEWERIDNVEEILHIYLKQLPEGTSTSDQKHCPVKPVDFDESLGKGQMTIGEDGLAHDLFNDCLYTEKENQTFARIWDLAIKPKSPFEFYSFLKKLYEKNAPWAIKPADTYKIPRHIHQIWIQGDLPEQYAKWQQTWQELLPGWKYTLWTDKEIRELPLKNRELYEKATNYGEKSDIARYEILDLLGGVYIDSDFECLNAEALDYFNRCYDFYGCLAPLDAAYLVCANGFIASAAGHPILREAIESLRYSCDESKPVHLKTGPALFTQAVYRCADQPGFTDIIFPPTFFYPVGMLTVIGGSYTTPDHYRALIKPESVALHYWGRSWSDAPRYQ